MAQTLGRLSIPFPRADDEQPTTPMDEAVVEMTAPPPIPRQTFKVKRRRPGIFESAVIPSIESSDPIDVDAGAPRSDLLSPLQRPLRFVTPPPPKTPAAQVKTYDMPDEWSVIKDKLVHRPRSSHSAVTDSSAASITSDNDSDYSYDGSCTSPESEIGSVKTPGLIPSSEAPTAKRVKRSRHARWTSEMDNHLWVTYMLYLQDPRVTPFKMLPGTAPPLGVCHRVAREARRTWRGQRDQTVIPVIAIHHADASPSHRGSPMQSPLMRTRWPRSEGATRRRLRDLCKNKPSLSAHYLRLLRAKSPSPFESPDSEKSSSVRQGSSTGTLSTSTPMAAPPSRAPMTSDSQSPRAAPPTPFARPQPSSERRQSEWATISGRPRVRARAQAHQKSQSLQFGLGLGRTTATWSSSSIDPDFERGNTLANPFDDAPSTRRTPNHAATQSLGRAYLSRNPTLAGNGAGLQSPFDNDARMPTARSLKRRFGVEDTPRNNNRSLQDVFTAPPPPAARSRGYSLSAVGRPLRNLSSLFTSPGLDQHMEEESGDSGLLEAPQAEPPRLGSPFGESSNTRFNTFPRRMNGARAVAAADDATLEDWFRRMSDR